MLVFSKYKRIIKAAGFEDLLKTNYWSYSSIIKKYIEPSVLQLPEESYEEYQKRVKEINSKENLAKRLEKLKELWDEIHDMITDPVIKESLEGLIHYGENWLNYYDILEKKHYECFYGKDFSLIISIWEGDLYLFDDKLDLDCLIKNNLIDHISTGREEEAVRPYKPSYITPKEPRDMSLAYQGYLKEKYKSIYQKELAQYQADLINAGAHNREEDRKYQESLSKTRMVKYIYLYYYASLEDKQDKKILEQKFPYSSFFYNYLCKNLPNIDMYNDFDSYFINGAFRDGIEYKGIKTVGVENVGYINILNDSVIKNTKVTDDSFEITFEDKNKIVVKNYGESDLEEIAKKYKKLKPESFLKEPPFLRYKVYLSNLPAYVSLTESSLYKEVLFKTRDNQVIYIHSSFGNVEMRTISLVASYITNHNDRNELETYNIFPLKK